MRKRMKKYLVFVLLVAVVLPSVMVSAAPLPLESNENDEVILTVNVGSKEGEIGYSDSLAGGGEGPEAFTVIDDIVYIVDNVNKRVNIYDEKGFINDIDVSYISYVRSIAVSEKYIYLMDYDAGMIYKISTNGKIENEIKLPSNMDNYLMKRLYVRDDGSVWLYYEEKRNGVENAGVDFSFLVDDLGVNNSNIQGYSINGQVAYNVDYCDDNIITIYGSSVDSDAESTVQNIKLISNEIISSADVLYMDDSTVYVDVFEMCDTSVTGGEYTVRKYVDSKCEEISVIGFDDYWFMPNNLIQVSDDGNLYQIKCFENNIQIIKKRFVKTDEYSSSIETLKKTLESIEDEQGRGVNAVTINAPNNKTTTMNNAMSCCQLSWTYTANNAVNPDSSNVTKPDYLVGVSFPSSQTGIPYCWGGFDGITTSSSSAWTSFADAMSKKKFAGNVNTSTSGYQSGTAGFDCSGFVSSVAGFSSKLSTSNLASSTYTYSVSAANRSLYDIYVKSGTHVLYYVGTSTNGINTREATTTGDDKTKLYTRSNTWISSYSLRRYNGW